MPSHILKLEIKSSIEIPLKLYALAAEPAGRKELQAQI